VSGAPLLADDVLAAVPRIAAGSFFSLDRACELLAVLRGYELAKVTEAVGLEVLAFFPGALRNGDLTWRIPVCDVQGLLGGPLERALTCREFARRLSVSVDAVEDAVRCGVLRKLPTLPRPLPQKWLIPSTELVRCFGEGLNVGAGRGRGRRGAGARAGVVKGVAA
jgi:hypothetical protein